jgi:PilZ domain-containing protein
MNVHCYGDVTREVTVANKNPGTNHNLPEDGLLMGKLVHLALPVRWGLVEQSGRNATEMACTYDIHPRGARLLSGREVNVGDLVMVERGRHKALCQVVWRGDPNSQLHGQFTVQCVEDGKAPWNDELRQMEEQYQPVILGGNRLPASRRGEENRRRRPRFSAAGKADVIAGLQRTEGQLQQLSECGARIATGNVLLPGTDFRLLLNLFEVNVALKAQVRYLDENASMGVEFHEIRLGDRPLLEYILRRLRKGVENFAKVEVVREMTAAAG